MNWKEIQGNYPKAFKKLQDHFNAHEMAYGDTPCHSWSDQYGRIDGSINTRDLYDFFDEYGIYISVMHRGALASIPAFQWKIGGDISEGYKTRPEAESQAFTEAFKILESN